MLKYYDVILSKNNFKSYRVENPGTEKILGWAAAKAAHPWHRQIWLYNYLSTYATNKAVTQFSKFFFFISYRVSLFFWKSNEDGSNSISLSRTYSLRRSIHQKPPEKCGTYIIVSNSPWVGLSKNYMLQPWHNFET